MKKSILIFALFLSITLSAQWTRQDSVTSVILRSVRAVDNNVVWACGNSGVVIRTVNGGTKWATKTITDAAYTNYSIEAIDSNTAWVAGNNATSGVDMKIWKTTDGGATWASQYGNANGFVNGVRFFDANNGVAYADPDPYPSGTWEIVTTTNGGTNWTRVAPANYPPADATNGEFGAAGSIYTVGNKVWFAGYSGVAGTPTSIYRSGDKGLTWAKSDVTMYAGKSTSTYMAFYDANNGMVVALDSTVGKTTDGGATWTMSKGPNVMRGITGAANSYEFLVVGSLGKIHYTANMGANWVQLTTPVTSTLYSVTAGNGKAWAVGANGVVLTFSWSPLPVELAAFTATANNGEVALRWSTATELNNRGFEVEKSFNGSEFVTVGFVQGKGTTTEANQYSFNDRVADAGKYTYRLKQVDLDGTFAYSSEINVDVTNPVEFALEQNYPNPFNPSTEIKFSVASESNVRLVVYNVLGEVVASLVNEVRAAGAHTVNFNAAALPSGSYVYEISAAPLNGQQEFRSVKKMSLVK